MAKNTTPSEHAEQCAFIQWWSLTLPQLRIFAIPNGGFRHAKVAKELKLEGLRPGVPDLYVPKLKLWIEFKRQKGGVLSKDQKDWRDYLINECGDNWIVVKGAADAISQVKKHLPDGEA